jgi:hypothetical protein
MASRQPVVRWAAVFTVVLLSSWTAATASAANLFANVSMFGGLISGGGVSSVTYLGTGQYEVTFTSDVSGCSYVSTTTNAYSQALQSYTAGGHLGPNGVYVETKNQGGGLTDGPFHLVVVCADPKEQFAVVGYSADLVRSTAGATLTHLGVGRYNVTFLASVKSCAFIATVGDPSNGLVYNPMGVYTGSAKSSKVVYIETKNPGGGLSDGVPFHLAVICPSTPKTYIAVINASGLPVRGSVLTSSYSPSTGRFVLVTKAAISPNCATVATRGSVDKAVPFNPATVEIVSGPAANTVGIEERELLFFGGNLYSDAIHVASVCN